MTTVVHLERVAAVDPAGIPLLMGVTLEVNEGDFVAIVGRHGSGKSALLRVLAAMQPISSGVARVAGFDLARIDYATRQRYHLEVGLVLESNGLLSTRTILDNICLPLLYHRPPTDARRLAEEIAHELAFDHSLHLPTLEATASVRKRAFLARALITQPKLLLVDEPQRALNEREKQVVAQAIERRRRDHGLTIVVADHDGELNPFVVNRTVQLEQGQVVHGSKE